MFQKYNKKRIILHLISFLSIQFNQLAEKNFFLYKK